MAISNGNGSSNRILWWIIGILSSISAGAGSNYVTRLDGMAELKSEVRVLIIRVDLLTEQLKNKRE